MLNDVAAIVSEKGLNNDVTSDVAAIVREKGLNNDVTNDEVRQRKQ